MAKRKSLREVLVTKVGEKEADKIIRSLESAARASALEPEFEEVLKKEFLRILQRRSRLISMLPPNPIAPEVGVAIGVEVGTAVAATQKVRRAAAGSPQKQTRKSE